MRYTSWLLVPYGDRHLQLQTPYEWSKFVFEKQSESKILCYVMFSWLFSFQNTHTLQYTYYTTRHGCLEEK